VQELCGDLQSVVRHARHQALLRALDEFTYLHFIPPGFISQCFRFWQALAIPIAWASAQFSLLRAAFLRQLHELERIEYCGRARRP
jgi:hypothetical protein